MTDNEQVKIAENYAISRFGMRKAKPGQHGYDGILSCGEKLQVKSKKHGVHSDAGTYVVLSEETIQGENAANYLLIVFVDETGKVTRRVPPCIEGRMLQNR